MSQKSAKQNRRVQELEALLRQEKEKSAGLEEEVKRLHEKLERMNEQFLNAQRARFGQSSEKATYVMADQIRLFNEAEENEDPKAEEPVEVSVAAHKRTKKPKRTLEELKGILPTREVIIDLPEEMLICAKCGGKLKCY